MYVFGSTFVPTFVCTHSFARVCFVCKKTNMHLQIRCTQGQNTSVHAIVAHAINESAKFGLHVCFVIAQNDFENNSEKPKQSKPNLQNYNFLKSVQTKRPSRSPVISACTK